jgi:phospholipid/cholesterol/gamma-HCH transport system substrate-binding protein
MESEARYTLVGAMLIALVVAAVGAVLWLKSSGSRQGVDWYTIYFQRQSLDGLQVGADVTMLGISVGKVEAYTVDRRTMNRVRVRVKSRRSRRSPRRPRRSCSGIS